MNRNQIPDKLISIIARNYTAMCLDFEEWANDYWDRFSRHLDDDFRTLGLALPYEKKGGCNE
jgi:Txe/YoeB family toxin of Txe-Axe toxin-antitoxin module